MRCSPAFLDGPGQRETAVVRLHGSAGNDGIRPLPQRIRHAEVELARLVAPGRSGKHVVALDEHVDLSAESL